MLWRKGLLLAAVCAVGLAAVQGGEKQAPPKRPRKPNPAYAEITEDPKLPRVLLIGDSISIGYTVPVRRLLEGKANVLRAPTNCGATTRGVAQLDRWLPVGKLDVVHFNFGLHDAKIMPPDGHLQVHIKDYEKNLRHIVARLKHTGATLVWATTTAVVDGEGCKRRNSDVQAYNAVARKIMEAEGIQIDDLYAALMDLGPKREKITTPDGTHFTAEGYDLLAEHVAAAVLRAVEAR